MSWKRGKTSRKRWANLSGCIKKLLASAKSTGIVPKKCWRSACTRGEHLPEFASKRWSNCGKIHEICLELAGMSWQRGKTSWKRLVNSWSAFKIAGLCQRHWNCTQKCWRSACTRGENLLEFASKRWSNWCRTHEICLELAGMSGKRGKTSWKRLVNSWSAFKIAGLCQRHWNCTRKCWRSACPRGENLLEFASKRWTNCCKIHEICLGFAVMSRKCFKMWWKRWVNFLTAIEIAGLFQRHWMAPKNDEQTPTPEVKTYWNLSQNGCQTASKPMKFVWNQLECSESVAKMSRKRWANRFECI